jgi:hypothetical protein
MTSDSSRFFTEIERFFVAYKSDKSHLTQNVRVVSFLRNNTKNSALFLKTHFSPLVDTIGVKKPVVKRVLGIFSLWFSDLAHFLQAKRLWKSLLIINKIASKPKVT